MKKKLLFLASLSLLLNASDFYYEYGKKVDVTKMPEKRDFNGQEVDVYKTSNGKKIGIKNEILVKCKNDDGCKKLFIEYSFKNLENLGSNFYLIKLDNNQNLFEISQKLYNEEETLFAHPNFIKERSKR